MTLRKQRFWGYRSPISFSQTREATVSDSKVRENAVANPLDAFSFVQDKKMNDVVVDRLDRNEAIASRFLNEPDFKKIIMEILTKQIWERIRKEEGVVA